MTINKKLDAIIKLMGDDENTLIVLETETIDKLFSQLEKKQGEVVSIKDRIPKNTLAEKLKIRGVGRGSKNIFFMPSNSFSELLNNI